MKSTLIILALLVSGSALALETQYTSIDHKDCVVRSSSEMEKEPEGDFYDAECAGLGGYQVTISGGDIRYDLKLSYHGQEVRKLVTTGAFHDMGAKKIEWRYKREKVDVFNSKIVYKALIFRINYAHYEEGQEHGPVNRDSLYVVKLDGANSCTVAIVPQSKDMNKKARVISNDIGNQVCL